MKKLLFLVIIVILVYLIYSLSLKKTNFLLINDSVNNLSNYINVSNNKLINIKNNTINSLYQSIINNDTINDSYYKKILRETDIIIINIGMEEISNVFLKYDINHNYIYFNNLISSISNLISEIRKYNYSKIIFIGYYNPFNYYDSKIDSLFYDLELKINNLLKEKDIIYIPMYEIIKTNNYKIYNTIYLNDLGKTYISKIIDNIYNKNT